MNKEIKEIIDYIDDRVIPNEKWEKIKDYITNLQEENEFLKLNNPEMNMEHFRIIKENKRKIDNLRKENERLNDELKRLRDLLNSQAYQDLDNYKSRNDKAIEYHNNCIENLKILEINDNEKLAHQVAYEIHKNYLNILQGRDK